MAKNYGYIPSSANDIKGKEFKASKTLPLPAKYSYKKYLPPVENQGSDPYCIPYSVGTWLNWKLNMKTGRKTDNKISYKDIYKSKTIEGEGMTYPEAFKYLRSHGVKSKSGNLKITDAGYVPSLGPLKAAIVLNGPCVGSLPIYDENKTEFWQDNGNAKKGWHSVTIVGYDEEGYIIRNTWGTSYGSGGYAHISEKDAKSFREIWTIMG